MERRPITTVAVRPGAALAARPRLFAALAEALGVRFVVRGPADGVLSLGGSVRGEGPVLDVRGAGGPGAEEVCLAATAGVDRRLHGVVLAGEPAAAPLAARGEVLARSDAGVRWVRDGRVQRVAAALPELGQRQTLRDALGLGLIAVRAVPARADRRRRPGTGPRDDPLRRPQPALAQLRLHRLRAPGRPRRRTRLPRGHGHDPARHAAAQRRDGRALPPARPPPVAGRPRQRPRLARTAAHRGARGGARTRRAGAAARRALRGAHRCAGRARHDAPARHVLRGHGRRARCAGLRRAVRDPPAAVDRASAGRPSARGLGGGRLRGRLRGHPARAPHRVAGGARPARLPRAPDRPLRAPRRRRRRPRAPGRGRRPGRRAGRRALDVARRHRAHQPRAAPRRRHGRRHPVCPAAARRRARGRERADRGAPARGRARPRGLPRRRRPGRPVRAPGPRGRATELRLVATTATDAAAVPPPAWRAWPVLRRLATETRDRAQPLLAR